VALLVFLSTSAGTWVIPTNFAFVKHKAIVTVANRWDEKSGLRTGYGIRFVNGPLKTLLAGVNE